MPLKLDHENAILTGVCAGIARRFGVDPLLVRLAFVGSVWFFGTGVLLYILLWVLMS